MKAKFVILAGLLFVLLTAGISAIAQAAEENSEQSCTSDQWAEFSPSLNDIVTTLATAEDPLAVLLQIDAFVSGIRATCTGGVWSSDDYGTGSSVIGPVVFSGTLYQGTLKSEKSALISLTAVEGNCGYESLSVLFADEEGNPDEDTALLKFDDCVAYFEIDGYGDPWTLTIEKIK